MKKLWDSISNIGVHKEHPFREVSSTRILNQMSVLVSLITLVYYLYDLILIKIPRSQEQVITYNILTFSILLHSGFVFFLNKKGHYKAARLFFIGMFITILFLNAYVLARPFHSDLYFFCCAAFAFIIFQDVRTILFIYLIQAVLFTLVVLRILDHHPNLTEVDGALFVRILLAFTYHFFILYLLLKENTTYQQEIEIKNIQVSADRDEIQKVNFTKDKIFSIISHDLRSPIGSLQAILGLLKRGQLSEQEFKKITTGLEEQVGQLKNTIDELLTWSKAQLHGITPSQEMLNLKHLIQEVITINRYPARTKKIIVTTNISNGAEAYCDPNMLKSILMNLLTNAIKFTPRGGAVTISCKSENGLARIHVGDTGIGISNENLKKINNSTVHFTTRGTNNETGTGLGLLMCYDFIHKNNGTLKIQSEEGKGSVFIISLPAFNSISITHEKVS